MEGGVRSGKDEGESGEDNKERGSRVLTGLEERGKAGMMSVKGWVLMIGKSWVGVEMVVGGRRGGGRQSWLLKGGRSKIEHLMRRRFLDCGPL